jgi:hypothetical protein
MLLTEPLLEVVRDFLRKKLKNVMEKDRSIRITNESKVPPYAGAEFINLYGSTCDNITNPVFPYREEIYSIRIGITRRLSAVPIDQTAETIYTYDDDLIYKDKRSMASRAFDIVDIIDGEYGIPRLVHQRNELKRYDFCATSPLNYLSSAAVEEVGADHFYGEDDSVNPQALFLELEFGEFHAFFNK